MALLKESFHFSWSESSIRYLGINLTPKFEQLYSVNYPPIYRKLETDLKLWSHHELPSWLSKINSVKMTLLPRLLYLFRSLRKSGRTTCPTFKVKSKFGWGKSGHRLLRQTLFRLRTKGDWASLIYYGIIRLQDLPSFPQSILNWSNQIGSTWRDRQSHPIS